MNSAGLTNFERGHKFFELSNHLGNVLVTVSDKKIGVDDDTDGDIDYYNADVVTANDYYPFGMLMSGRSYTNGSGYRYGFNGKEKDNEMLGEGNAYDFGARIQDPRLGRWVSVDPLQQKYTDLSPYQYCANSPVSAKDPDGRLIIFINGLWGWPNQVGRGGTEDYWGADWVSRVQSQIGDYKTPRYYDGSLGELPHGHIQEQTLMHQLE